MTTHYFLDKLPHVHTIPPSQLNPLSLPVLLAIVLVLVLALPLQAYLATRRPKNFPPGPPTTPFLGNILDIPLSKPCVTFAKWAQSYGPILGIKAGPVNMVVLHDPDDIHELYDRRGSTYAGRPYNYIALNHVFEPDIGQIYLFQRNDRLLKRWKRPARWFLSQQGIEGIMPILDAVGARCIKALCDSPSQFLDHLRVWAFSTPLIVLSGQAHINQDLLRTYFYRQQLVTELLEPGKTPPVDFIAPLRWLPTFLAKWKRDAYFVRKHQDAFYGEMLAGATSNRQRRKEGDKSIGEYEPVMTRLLGEGMPEREVKWLAGGLLDAAFDTTSAAIVNFVVALAGHADVLKKAREEVEVVCEGRMPTGEDVGKMPYLKACLMEVSTLTLKLFRHVNQVPDIPMASFSTSWSPTRHRLRRHIQRILNPTRHKHHSQRLCHPPQPRRAPKPNSIRPNTLPRPRKANGRAQQEHMDLWRRAETMRGRSIHDACVDGDHGQDGLGDGYEGS